MTWGKESLVDMGKIIWYFVEVYYVIVFPVVWKKLVRLKNLSSDFRKKHPSQVISRREWTKTWYLTKTAMPCFFPV